MEEIDFENDANLQAIFSSDCRNKRLQCYASSKNFFDQPIKMV